MEGFKHLSEDVLERLVSGFCVVPAAVGSWIFGLSSFSEGKAECLGDDLKVFPQWVLSKMHVC